jgi:hypothetical protein
MTTYLAYDRPHVCVEGTLQTRRSLGYKRPIGVRLVQVLGNTERVGHERSGVRVVDGRESVFRLAVGDGSRFLLQLKV